MKVLVTGGGGFLGRAVIRSLAREGHEPVNLSRKDYPDLREMGVRTVRGDICDPKTVKKALEGAHAVIHTAAKVGFWGDYSEFHRTNVDGTKVLLEACKNKGIHNFIYTSSPSVVFTGKDLEGVDESIPYPDDHGSHYNATKTIAERMVLAANSDELHTIALRPHLVWGPGDERLAPRLIEAAREKRLSIIGSGRKMIDTVYIDNAAQAHLLALKGKQDNPECRGRPYFISNDEPVNTWEIINRFIAMVDLPPIKRKVPRWVAMLGAWIEENRHRISGAPGEPKITRFLDSELSTSHWFDISAAKRDLGYRPTVSIDQGLRIYETQLKGISRRSSP